MPSIEQGRIVWAELASLDGTTTKRRPAVIITPTDEIKSDQPFAVVAATTKFSEPLPDDHVHLPWHHQGKVRTRLRQATVVVCRWLSTIRVEVIQNYGGVVPPETMAEILAAVARLKKSKGT